jgi:predicted nicotinamide N-methyase
LPNKPIAISTGNLITVNSALLDYKNTIDQNLKKTISQARLVATALPLCPQVSLFLLADDYPKGRMPDEVMLRILEAPAYWAFCWASGQVMAKYLLQNPNLVRGKSVLDFGSGSGVVAIAAAMAGAKSVIACDNDPFSQDAIQANAALNNVELSQLLHLGELEDNVDMVLAADVLYDRDNFSLLEVLPKLGNEIIIADSRIKHFELRGYEILDRVTATTIPDLDELREYSHVKVYRGLNSPRFVSGAEIAKA